MYILLTYCLVLSFSYHFTEVSNGVNSDEAYMENGYNFYSNLIIAHWLVDQKTRVTLVSQCSDFFLEKLRCGLIQFVVASPLNYWTVCCLLWTVYRKTVLLFFFCCYIACSKLWARNNSVLFLSFTQICGLCPH